MLRHLPRYTRGVDVALRSDRLAARDLSQLTPYLPNLGTAWMSAAADPCPSILGDGRCHGSQPLLR